MSDRDWRAARRDTGEKQQFGREFFAASARFPSVEGSRRWGTRTIHVLLPTGSCELRGLSPAMQAALTVHFRAFAKTGAVGPAASSVELLRAERDCFRPWRGEVYTLDLRPMRRAVETASDRVRGVVSLGATTQLHLWFPRLSPMELVGTIENHLRVLAAYDLVRSGGVLLHAGCVVIDGEAHVFFGHSGAGKTTASRLAAVRGARMLSDDMTALLPVAGRLHVIGAPFKGEGGGVANPGERAPVRAIYALEKADRVKRGRLSAAGAVAALAAVAPFVNLDPFRQALLLDRLTSIAAAVPAYRLEFRRDTTFWSVLEGRPA